MDPQEHRQWVVIDEQGRPVFGETFRHVREDWGRRSMGGTAKERLALGVILLFLALFLTGLGIITLVWGLVDLVLGVFRRR